MARFAAELIDHFATHHDIASDFQLGLTSGRIIGLGHVQVFVQPPKRVDRLAVVPYRWAALRDADVGDRADGTKATTLVRTALDRSLHLGGIDLLVWALECCWRGGCSRSNDSRLTSKRRAAVTRRDTDLQSKRIARESWGRTI
jgi:hypothetical protein